MKCQKCGKELNDDFQVCPYCGNPVTRNTNEQPQQSEQPTPQPQPQQSRQTQPMPQKGSYNTGNRQNVQPPKKSNVLGILALIFGIIGMILSCLYVGIVPAIAGIVLGVIGIVKNNRKGMSIAGLACGAVGFVIFCVIMLATYSESPDTASDTQIESQLEIETEQLIEEDSETQPAEETETQTEIQDIETESEGDSEEVEELAEISTTDERQAFIDSCEEFDYKQIARNPDDYIGKNFKVNVEVFSISEGSLLTSSYLKAYTDDGSGYYYDHLIYIYDEQDKDSPDYVKPLEEDIITVYGTFEEMVETTNFINGEKGEEIALHMKYAELISE